MKVEFQQTSGRTTSEDEGDEWGRLVGGLALVAAGLTLLAGQFFTLGAWPLLLLGLIFCAAGVTTRSAPWFIPGGVLNGVSLGALQIEYGLAGGEATQGGLFLLALSLGWLSVFVLSRVFTPHPIRWALIPSGVLALVGVAALLGPTGEAALSLIGFVWPLALIGGGLWFLARRRA